MNINELCEDETCDAIVQLVKNCPLLAVEKGVNSVLLDLVELVFHPGIVAELMALGSKVMIKSMTRTPMRRFRMEYFIIQSPVLCLFMSSTQNALTVS